MNRTREPALVERIRRPTGGRAADSRASAGGAADAELRRAARVGPRAHAAR